ncbi:MAG: DUF4380 domain-containing protein [Prolixibacteraceae bacterium]|nr:DUF4380 domain-containing protein [Prolixibacteraceae bacterium]
MKKNIRSLKLVLTLVFCFVFLSSTYSKIIFQEGGSMVFILSEDLRIGLLPDVGGRMVFFGAPGGENMLFSDSTQWNEPEADRITPSPDAGFKAYNGLIYWLGPQSQWWRQQKVNSGRYKRGDWWPPDPYLIYSEYSVEILSDTSVLLASPNSPVSGVQMTKKYAVSGDKLFITVSLRNIRDEPIAWDIWSNARFEAFTPFRIPLDLTEIIRIKAKETDKVDIIPYSLTDGYFSLETIPPSVGKLYSEVKAFLHPDEGIMLVDKAPYQLTIEFDVVPCEAIHPEQALVEVYNKVSVDGKSNLLELEHHSAYETIPTGGMLEMKESWTLVEIE